MRFCAIAFAVLVVFTGSLSSDSSAANADIADLRSSTLLSAPLTASLSKQPAAQPPLKFDSRATAEENTRRLHSRKSDYLLAQVIAKRSQLPSLDKLVGATCQVQAGIGENAAFGVGRVFAFEFTDPAHVRVYIRVEARDLQHAASANKASVRFTR
ncbi:MAG TPA: hypothetical protein DDW52_00310 [Planctomycetaceae bacterium]|nr:hypothetical protein [Planctomycetaceae bacterium]